MKKKKYNTKKKFKILDYIPHQGLSFKQFVNIFRKTKF